MSSAEAVTAIISWLRFKKGWPYVASEVDVLGSYKADVLGSDGKMLVEYEVKTNIEDVKRDFANKGDKHIIYGNLEPIVQRDENHWTKGRLVGEVCNRYGEKWTFRVYTDKDEKRIKERPEGRGWDSGLSYFYPSSWDGYTTKEVAIQKLHEKLEKKTGVPNMLVYVVHHSIAAKAAEIIPEEYGVVSFMSFRFSTVNTVRKPKKLHNLPVAEAKLVNMVKRMSSELANFHIHGQSDKNGLAEVLEMTKSNCELDGLFDDDSQNETPKP